jgi:hypothetical protein
MFRVENADFIADKLASELLPLQENREAAKNAEEAIRRRLLLKNQPPGRVVFDVDWSLLNSGSNWYLSCADNGDGMTRQELERYTTTLAVQGANDNQSLHGNQGMGLKISGPTRHREGVLIRSLKNGERSMVRVGWSRETEQYDLIPIGRDGEKVIEVDEDFFPDFIKTSGSGTVVTFLGNTPDDNTFRPADRARGWLFRYLNQRFFRYAHEDVEMLVRVPSGDQADWPTSVAEADQRMKGNGKSFNLSKVRGTGEVWDDAAEKNGPNSSGVVDLDAGGATGSVPARVHWWVLPSTGASSDVTSRTFGGGTIAVLYQNELHDWRTGNQANPFFARMGVLYGKTRVSFVIEPLGESVTSDFARAHVLVSGHPVFETDTLIDWCDRFRALMPEAIKAAMLEEQSRLQADDPDRAKRIRERLKEVMSLLRPHRYRRDSRGERNAEGPVLTGAGEGTGSSVERSTGDGSRNGSGRPRGVGDLLSQLQSTGDPASEVFAALQIEPKWVTEKEAEGMAIVNGNDRGIHDRAAGLVGQDGATAPILALNREFRGYRAIVAALNEWGNPEGDETKSELLEAAAQEWIEQKMVEAVTGLRQLENGSSWTATNFDDALSPVALTAAFMADRYHTLREVKRQSSGLRRVDVTASV